MITELQRNTYFELVLQLTALNKKYVKSDGDCCVECSAPASIASDYIITNNAMQICETQFLQGGMTWPEVVSLYREAHKKAMSDLAWRDFIGKIL